MAVAAVAALAIVSPLGGAPGWAQTAPHRGAPASAGEISTVAGGVGGAGFLIADGGTINSDNSRIREVAG